MVVPTQVSRQDRSGEDRCRSEQSPHPPPPLSPPGSSKAHAHAPKPTAGGDTHKETWHSVTSSHSCVTKKEISWFTLKILNLHTDIDRYVNKMQGYGHEHKNVLCTFSISFDEINVFLCVLSLHPTVCTWFK